MLKTVTAFKNRQLGQSVRTALEQSGIQVQAECSTGAEAVRAIRKLGSGVVVCSFYLRDMTANEMIDYIRGSAAVLVIGKPATLALCKTDLQERLALPVVRKDLIEKVRELHEQQQRKNGRLSRRSPEDEAVIQEAKELLMQKRNLSESGAHRYLQKMSMNAGLTMRMTSRAVIRQLGKEPDSESSK